MPSEKILILKLNCGIFVYVSIVVYPLVAQSVEQLPFKETVVGSIPTKRT